MVDGLIVLTMEAVRISEALVDLYQSTRRYNPEDIHLHTHRRENLKFYTNKFTLPFYGNNLHVSLISTSLGRP
jgi:hypothetical protein